MMDCDNHIVNDKYWSSIPSFVKKDIKIELLGIIILGYFPYHTARIRPIGVSQTYLPRQLFEGFELALVTHRINDNKVVYICKPIETFTGAGPFAIMLKDEYAMTGPWSNVVGYDNKPFKVNSKG